MSAFPIQTTFSGKSSRPLHECLHDAEFEFDDVKTFNVTGNLPGKIYRGEQLILFGQYNKGGEAHLKLKARLTGEDKTYTTSSNFPDIDTDNPEIERLWALDQIEQMELRANRGEMPASESEDAIRDLGLEYKLVTDETSMLVLADESFEKYGIDRRNRKRLGPLRIACLRTLATRHSRQSLIGAGSPRISSQDRF